MMMGINRDQGRKLNVDHSLEIHSDRCSQDEDSQQRE